MIALGTPVTYHHRAAVARFTKPVDSTGPRHWLLFEGVGKDEVRPDEPLWSLRDLFHDHARIPTRRGGTINKTVMVWPEEGSGVVTGRVRRQRGISEGAHRGYSQFGEDFEPGYFSPTDTFRLYVVRHALDGTGYILVPEWAVAPLHYSKELLGG